MAGGDLMILVLLILFACLMASRIWGRPFAQLLAQRWPTFVMEGDQILLWGGIILSALSIGLLALYLLLQP